MFLTAGTDLLSVASGGFYSTPWDSSGNVSSTWVSNLETFLADLHGYGIARVTPTPALDSWGGTPITPSSPVYDCTGTTPLVFFPWMPYGHISTNGYPDCQDVNTAYSSANSNPYFWGWTPFYNLVYDIFGAISSSGLTLGEFDIYNEMDLLNFTVQARLFYDNSHGGGTDVLGTLRSYASYYGFDPYSITVSTPASNPSSSGYHCGSVYGDSAVLLDESELIGALAGGYSAFGVPSGYSIINNLVCGGTVGTMTALPVSYTQPDVTDVHVYPCVINSGVCDTTLNVTATATTAYSDIWSLLYYRSMTGNTAMIGETHSNQNCDGYTATMAGENVSGYQASILYSNHASGTTLRVWDNDASSCYSTPSTINPPYTP